MLDRFILSTTWPALAASAAFEAALWFAGTPEFAATAGAIVLAIGLAIAYGSLAKHGEFLALLAAGIAPRRTGAVVVIGAAIVAAIESAASSVLRPPVLRTEHVAYALSALQPVLIASSVLPLSVRNPGREPWARVLLLLVIYVACLVMVRTLVRVTDSAHGGLYWVYIVAALALYDIFLYRQLTAESPAL
jgi:lipopolysaccharide export LptBFGC system permease protein LptF